MRFVKLAFWNEFGACRFIVCLEFLAGNATISSERPSVVLRYPIDACRRHPSAISAARARGDRGRGPTPTGVGRGRTVSATAAAVLSVTPYSMPIPDPAVPLACHAPSNAQLAADRAVEVRLLRKQENLCVVLDAFQGWRFRMEVAPGGIYVLASDGWG